MLNATLRVKEDRSVDPEVIEDHALVIVHTLPIFRVGCHSDSMTRLCSRNNLLIASNGQDATYHKLGVIRHRPAPQPACMAPGSCSISRLPACLPLPARPSFPPCLSSRKPMPLPSVMSSSGTVSYPRRSNSAAGFLASPTMPGRGRTCGRWRDGRRRLHHRPR
jgi:hypothetical protein